MSMKKLLFCPNFFAKNVDAEDSEVEFSKWSKKFDHFDKIVSD